MVARVSPAPTTSEWESCLALSKLWFSDPASPKREFFALNMRRRVEDLERFFHPYESGSLGSRGPTSLAGNRFTFKFPSPGAQMELFDWPPRSPHAEPLKQSFSNLVAFPSLPRAAERQESFPAKPHFSPPSPGPPNPTPAQISTRPTRKTQSCLPGQGELIPSAYASRLSVNPFQCKFAVQARPESLRATHSKPQYDPGVHTHYTAWIRQFAKMLMDSLTGNRNLNVLKSVCSGEVLRTLRLRAKLEHDYYRLRPVLVGQIKIHSIHTYPTGDGPFGFRNIEAMVLVRVGERFRG